jgi:hypothetical protein
MKNFISTERAYLNNSIIKLMLFVTFLFFALTSQARPTITITVSGGDWGEAKTQDIKKVLESAADELLSDVSSVDEISIIVKNDSTRPKTLYKKGINGEFIILLDVVDRYWSKYAYQFSHELSHVLTMNKSDSQTPNQWFEEAIGETASSFAMRKMAKKWRDNPPYSNWKDYTSSLSKYVESNIAEDHRKLPSNQTFIEWFEDNEDGLRANPYLRDKDELISNQLLGFFEDYPQGWDAVTYINQTKPTSTQTFGNYLGNWYHDAPQRHKQFIGKVCSLFNYRCK